ncbi:hypothetical protein AAIA72_14945 [Hahella sp. SMD15-11]|uniref:DUF1449 family protein n=1 Tax=Thermohahella caldifontis TaxID=3142973 RepID=A0AB39UVQ6_9GAMM
MREFSQSKLRSEIFGFFCSALFWSVLAGGAYVFGLVWLVYFLGIMAAIFVAKLLLYSLALFLGEDKGFSPTTFFERLNDLDSEEEVVNVYLFGGVFKLIKSKGQDVDGLLDSFNNGDIDSILCEMRGKLYDVVKGTNLEDAIGETIIEGFEVESESSLFVYLSPPVGRYILARYDGKDWDFIF